MSGSSGSFQFRATSLPAPMKSGQLRFIHKCAIYIKLPEDAPRPYGTLSASPAGGRVLKPPNQGQDEVHRQCNNNNGDEI